MSRWINGRPGMWYGYTDLGPIQIPVMPMYIGMTDRDTGTVYYLTHNVTVSSPDGLGHVSMQDNVPVTQPTKIYAAYEGPVMGSNPTLRLLVRGGRIGYEVIANDGATVIDNSPPILTRQHGNNLFPSTRLIYKPSWWTPAHIPANAAAMSDELAWTPENF